MIKGNSFIKKSKKEINDDLRKEYILSSNDETFKKLCNTLKSDDDILMKYTSKLEVTSSELKNCSKCKNLSTCKNEITGYVYYPIKKNDNLEFMYKPCKYQKEEIKRNTIKNKTIFFDTPKILQSASLSDLINEKERTNILKYIKEFLKKKINNEDVKGLYLSGSFGSGKDEIMTSNILLLDDIGAENNSPWARDEVLSVILQYRMDNNLTTFFTSNYTIDELDKVLSETSKGIDEIKSRRIIERIKYLTIEEKLISKDKRN